mmetsp:Transcript_5192/g.12396  ORF Transcript_5192/g.12396 Transcript_5192/m.12396 type:complete len:263 (+) Transcript_5192:422-1210(+)
MGNKGRLDLGCSDAVTTDVDDIVHAAGDKVIAFGVAHDTVTGKVVALVGFQIHREVSIVSAQAGSGHSGPGLSDGQNTFRNAILIGLHNFSTCRIQDHGIDTVAWQGTRSRLHGRDSGQIGDNVTTRFCLPVSIHHGAFGLADIFVIPTPRLGVDWFSDRSEDFQTAQIIFGGGLGSVFHQKSNCSGRSVELGDFVAFDHVPIPSSIRVDGCRFEHECCATIEKWPIHNVCVTGNPSAIRHASKNIVGCQIECVFDGLSGIQ